MNAKIRKWGNSLGIRIPKPLAEEAMVCDGASVELTVEEGRLVITPQAKKRYPLDSLLKKITAENLHRETDFGRSAGKESL